MKGRHDERDVRYESFTRIRAGNLETDILTGNDTLAPV